MAVTHSEEARKAMRIAVAATRDARFALLAPFEQRSAFNAWKAGIPHFEAVVDNGVVERQRFELRLLFGDKTCDGCGATEGQYHGIVCPTMDVQHPLSDEAEAQSRAAVRSELEDGAYDIKRQDRSPYFAKQLEGEWGTSIPELLKDLSPTTPYMELAIRALKGVDYAEKTRELRNARELTEQELDDICGIKLRVDPAVGVDTLVFTPARQQGKSWYAAAAEKLWGKHAGQWIASVHDEVMYADPSAMRDALALASGPTKPENRPHRQEKPANPYPPPHGRIEPPAGLMAVSDMSARMGNRWAP